MQLEQKQYNQTTRVLLFRKISTALTSTCCTVDEKGWVQFPTRKERYEKRFSLESSRQLGQIWFEKWGVAKRRRIAQDLGYHTLKFLFNIHKSISFCKVAT